MPNYENVTVEVTELLLDQANARFKEEQPSQQQAALELAKLQGDHIVNLAEDIVEEGLDPLALPAITATDDRVARYVVMEGNRRVLALKALETPALVSPALSQHQQRRLNRLSAQYVNNPISQVQCVLFDSEKDARHWIELRHTGKNEGIGLSEWGSDEKDRYAARHGTRSDAGQIIDFVDKHGTLSEDAQESSARIFTSVRRLISTPEVRDKLGIDVAQGQVYSHYPTDEIAKPLTYIVEQFKTGELHVGDIYRADQRREFAGKIPRSHLPKRSTRLPDPVDLDTLATSKPKTAPKKKSRRKTRKTAERTAVVPRDCDLVINPPRINYIFNELSSLSVDQYPNACSVLLRVFLELSVDSYLSHEQLMSDGEMRSEPLAKRLKAVAKDLNGKGKIPKQLRTAIDRVADSKRFLHPATVTMNQYVHNQFVFPTAGELRTSWDELQPFFEKVWEG